MMRNLFAMPLPSGAQLAVLATTLFCASSVARASVIYTLTIDLSTYHAGSDVTGSVVLAAPLALGQSTPITMVSVPAADYSLSLNPLTLSVTTGPSGFNSIFFSSFTLTDNLTAATHNIAVDGAAHCAVSISNPNGFPCQTNGLWIENGPGGGSGNYSVTANTLVPEPAYCGLLLMLGGLAGVRRAFRRSRAV